MNTFASTINPTTNGILKKDYEPNSPQIEALKRRRAKLTNKLGVSTREELELEPKPGE